MSNERQYQVRIFLTEEFAAAARKNETPEGMKPLMDILAKHDAALDHNQFDEFKEMVKSALDGWDDFNFGSNDMKEMNRRLAILTTDSLLTDEKRDWFKREFTLKIGDKYMLTGDAGDALVADLQALGDGAIITSGKAFMPGVTRDVPPVRKSYIPARHPGT